MSFLHFLFSFFLKKHFSLGVQMSVSLWKRAPRAKKKEEKEEKKLFLRGIFHREFRGKGNCLFTSVSKQIFSYSTFVQPPRLRARGVVSDWPREPFLGFPFRRIRISQILALGQEAGEKSPQKDMGKLWVFSPWGRSREDLPCAAGSRISSLFA